MKPLVIIPARGGSKGVPGKNAKHLNGKPLIQYTIEAALEVFDKEDILVSTDSEEIKQIAENCGLHVPFLRPAHLSEDTSSSRDVILHAFSHSKEVEGKDPDTIILLQPTSPFRTGKNIEGAIELFNDETEVVVSVKKTKSNPYYILFEENDHSFLSASKSGNYLRRQDIPDVYELNGAIYIFRPEHVQSKNILESDRIRKYLMEEIPSHDIDTPLDWEVAEIIAKNLGSFGL